MSNQNYAQVADLMAAQQLNWVTDSIVALLTKDASFHIGNKRLSDTGSRAIVSSQIQGRYIDGTMAMGLPAVFGQVAAEQEYQVLVAKDDGRNDPLLLAFMNEDTSGDPISVLRSGTLIVRPSQENLSPPDPPFSPTTGFWMNLG